MQKLRYDPKKCLACKTCEVVCAVGHSNAKELFLALEEKDLSLPNVKIYAKADKNFPVACRHCDEPKCVVACMSAALTKDPETGKVLYNKDKCVGCWMCVMVCPYGAIRPNPKTKKTVRCDLCEGEDKPRCADACPVEAIIVETE